MRSVKPGGKNPRHFSQIRLHLDHACPTVRKAVNGLANYDYWHPVEHRVITIMECKRISSFPDAFQFVGKPNEAWERIGNTVPPRFMQAIATHVYERILAPTSCAVAATQ